LQPTHQSDHLTDLRSKLEQIAGVERLLAMTPEDGTWLLCSPQAAYGRVIETARDLISETGAGSVLHPIEVVIPALRRERRVRFEAVARTEEPDRRVRVQVTLGLDHETRTGEAVGEKGDAIELRTAASAAVVALEGITGRELGVRLVGVKQLRAFDAELVVVSMSGGGQKLLGAVLAGPDPLRATALAVLSGLNRMLGNYLAR
jgi:hypothetical protein